MMDRLHRPGLLVSVRSAEEAQAALAGGADLIDVKEPSRGSLGRADDETIAAVVAAVGGRRPVSAALGELRGNPSPCSVPGLIYVKWGLAGLANQVAPESDGPAPVGGRGSGRADPVGGAIGSAGASPSHSDRPWTKEIARSLTGQRASNAACQCVLVAYADWSRAGAPRPEAVCTLAVQLDAAALLVDTFHKDGRTLLDWLTVDEVAELCRCCRRHGLRIALAGSLGQREIAWLGVLNPDWFAVRGAACGRGRESAIDAERVRSLVRVLDEPVAAAMSAS